MQKEVDYYNKEITKKQQRNNKDSDREVTSTSSSSLGLVTQGVTSLKEEVALAESQEEAKPDFSHIDIQAPTSPPKLITSTNVKRAVVQYYQNAGKNKLQKHKLKIRLNCDFGNDKEENVEFIAALTQDLSNFKKYHPEESRQEIVSWTDVNRKAIKHQLEVNAHLGKFHANSGWDDSGSKFNQIEPWSACLLWYNHRTKNYQCLVRIYDWEETFVLSNDNLTDKQIKTNIKAQKIWYNPQHLNIQRPKTWAQQRFPDKCNK